MSALSLRQIYIEDKYLVMHSIGSGHFGDIRVAKDVEKNSFIAIKLEESDKTSKLASEYELYKRVHETVPILKNTNPRLAASFDGFPKIFSYGSIDNYNYIMMELLGFNLESLYNICERRFSHKTIAMIGIQMLHRLEVLHSCRIVYRDIKPENFVIGVKTNTRHIIYMIDFGLAKEIAIPRIIESQNSEHSKKVVGTCRYMSLNAHRGVEQNRKDDLESLGYLLVYFCKGSLPWQGVKTDEIHMKYQKVYDLKKSISIQNLSKGCPPELQTYLKYIRNMSSEAMPDYGYLEGLMHNIIKGMRSVCDWNFEWLSRDLTVSGESSEEKLDLIKSEDIFCKKDSCCPCCIFIKSKRS